MGKENALIYFVGDIAPLASMACGLINAAKLRRLAVSEGICKGLDCAQTSKIAKFCQHFRMENCVCKIAKLQSLHTPFSNLKIKSFAIRFKNAVDARWRQGLKA